MDTLKNKTFNKYDYTCRQTGIPYYYDNLNEQFVSGLGANLLKNASWYSHKVIPGDTLEYLALKYYNNPTYWWIIAYYNDLFDAFDNLAENYTTLKIPNMSEITFGDLR